MQARLSCSAHRRFRRAGHTLRDFNDNYQYDQNGNLLWQQPVGGVSTGFLENSPSTHYYWLPTPQGDILVGFDQGINSYAVYTDHLGTPRLVTKIESPQNPKPITDTSNDLPLADYGQPEGISPMAIPVWQWSYSPFGADLANGYEARPTTMVNNFKPDLWSWMGLPETGGADANQVAQETWRIEQNLHIQPVLNIRYPGQYYDFESGLVQNWWRTYEPRIGRYTSADPIGLGGGWNRFAYAGQDGINGFDPDGLQFRVAPRRTTRPYGSGNARQRRYDRRHSPPPPIRYGTSGVEGDAAGYFDDEGEFICVRWSCGPQSNTCFKDPYDRRGDKRRSADFLPEANDASNPPSGCVCDEQRFRQIGGPGSFDVMDYIDLATKGANTDKTRFIRKLLGK